MLKVYTLLYIKIIFMFKMYACTCLQGGGLCSTATKSLQLGFRRSEDD